MRRHWTGLSQDTAGAGPRCLRARLRHDPATASRRGGAEDPASPAVICAPPARPCEVLAGAPPARRTAREAMRVTLLLDEIAAATARLAEAGIDSPRADAEMIAAYVHGVGRGDLQLVPDGDF